MAIETELKLLIDEASLPKLRRHPLLKAQCRDKAVRAKLHSIYFDTPDRELHRADMALRLRRTGRHWTQTVKGGGGVRAGLHQRREFEVALSSPIPRLDRITDPDLLQVFTPRLQRHLQPIFVTEFWRTAWLLEFPGGDRVELALDVGEIKAGEDHSAISEVELELKAGGSARLFQSALELQRTIPLRIENRSKAERGYDLLRPAGFAAVKATPPSIGRGMAAAGALREILGACLAHLQDNANGVLYGEDPESIHQMRVATRRLLSALRLLATAASEGWPTELAEELRWLMSALGPARDWDVFLEDTLPPVLACFPDHPGLGELRRQALNRRAACRQTAREAVGCQRYTRLVLTFGAWLADAWWDETGKGKGTLAGPVTALARDLLSERQRRLSRRGRGLAKLDAGQRHRLRIAAKRMRYSLEFFAPLYPRKAVDGYLKRLTTLQDRLGALNDAVATHTLLAQLGTDEARGLVGGWVECRAAQGLGGLPKAWDGYQGGKVFW